MLLEVTLNKLQLFFFILYFRFNKKKRNNDWFVKAADEAGIDIDDAQLYPYTMRSSPAQTHNLCSDLVLT